MPKELDYTITSNKEYASGVRVEGEKLIWWFVDDIMIPEKSRHEHPQTLEDLLENGPYRNHIGWNFTGNLIALDSIFDHFKIPQSKRKYYQNLPPDQKTTAEYAELSETYQKRWKKYIKKSMNKTLEIAQDTKATNILDIGCGTGELLEKLTKTHPQAKLTGIDLSAAMLKHAKEKLPKSINLLQGNAATLPLKSNSFDLIFSLSSFHYWQNQTQALQEVFRVLKSDGNFILTDWCKDFLSIRLIEKHLRNKDRAHNNAATLREIKVALDNSRLHPQDSKKYRISPLWGLMTIKAKKF